jgi:uncharacterized protein
MKPVLLDTGVVVALLDRSEKSHKKCVKIVESLEAPLITCEAVIAESCYLVRNLKGAAECIIENVAKGIFHCVFDLALSAKEVRILMKKYQSIPMDFADACLVTLASEYETGTILTLDSDFMTYRWGRNRPFEYLL